MTTTASRTANVAHLAIFQQDAGLGVRVDTGWPVGLSTCGRHKAFHGAVLGRPTRLQIGRHTPQCRRPGDTIGVLAKGNIHLSGQIEQFLALAATLSGSHDHQPVRVGFIRTETLRQRSAGRSFKVERRDRRHWLKQNAVVGVAGRVQPAGVKHDGCDNHRPKAERKQQERCATTATGLLRGWPFVLFLVGYPVSHCHCHYWLLSFDNSRFL